MGKNDGAMVRWKSILTAIGSLDPKVIREHVVVNKDNGEVLIKFTSEDVSDAVLAEELYEALSLYVQGWLSQSTKQSKDKAGLGIALKCLANTASVITEYCPNASENYFKEYLEIVFTVLFGILGGQKDIVEDLGPSMHNVTSTLFHSIAHNICTSPNNLADLWGHHKNEDFVRAVLEYADILCMILWDGVNGIPLGEFNEHKNRSTSNIMSELFLCLSACHDLVTVMCVADEQYLVVLAAMKSLEGGLFDGLVRVLRLASTRRDVAGRPEFDTALFSCLEMLYCMVERQEPLCFLDYVFECQVEMFPMVLAVMQAAVTLMSTWVKDALWHLPATAELFKVLDAFSDDTNFKVFFVQRACQCIVKFFMQKSEDIQKLLDRALNGPENEQRYRRESLQLFLKIMTNLHFFHPEYSHEEDCDKFVEKIATTLAEIERQSKKLVAMFPNLQNVEKSFLSNLAVFTESGADGYELISAEDHETLSDFKKKLIVYYTKAKACDKIMEPVENAKGAPKPKEVVNIKVEDKVGTSGTLQEKSPAREGRKKVQEKTEQGQITPEKRKTRSADRVSRSGKRIAL